MYPRTIEPAIHRRRVAVLTPWLLLAPLAVGLGLLAGCDDSRPPVRVHTCLLAGLGEDDPLWPILKASAEPTSARPAASSSSCSRRGHRTPPPKPT